MMRFVWLACAAATAVLAAAPGCKLLQPEATGHRTLQPLEASAGSVTLEIFFARFPAGATALNTELWDQIDEQVFPAETRRELAHSGIRAGVVGAHVPVELARLLTLTDHAPEAHEGQQVSLEAEPMVNMRRLTVRGGRRSELVASHSYDQLPLLMREADQVVGRTYAKAEGRFGLWATSQSDGRVELEMLPELQHGEQQQRWTATDGIIRLDACRPKRVFDELRLKLDLLPGQMLVLSCRPDRPGSLGHYFFTEPMAEALAQKIIILRVTQAGSDRSFVDESGAAVAEDIPSDL